MQYLWERAMPAKVIAGMPRSHKVIQTVALATTLKNTPHEAIY